MARVQVPIVQEYQERLMAALVAAVEVQVSAARAAAAAAIMAAAAAIAGAAAPGHPVVVAVLSIQVAAQPIHKVVIQEMVQLPFHIISILDQLSFRQAVCPADLPSIWD